MVPVFVVFIDDVAAVVVVVANAVSALVAADVFVPLLLFSEFLVDKFVTLAAIFGFFISFLRLLLLLYSMLLTPLLLSWSWSMKMWNCPLCPNDLILAIVSKPEFKGFDVSQQVLSLLHITGHRCGCM